MQESLKYLCKCNKRISDRWHSTSENEQNEQNLWNEEIENEALKSMLWIGMRIRHWETCLCQNKDSSLLEALVVNKTKLGKFKNHLTNIFQAVVGIHVINMKLEYKHFTSGKSNIS